MKYKEFGTDIYFITVILYNINMEKQEGWVKR